MEVCIDVRTSDKIHHSLFKAVNELSLSILKGVTEKISILYVVVYDDDDVMPANQRGSVASISQDIFTIGLKSGHVDDLTCTLAHELKHIEQFLSGRLSQILIDGKRGWIWEGKIFLPETPYCDRPWEAEARKAVIEHVF